MARTKLGLRGGRAGALGRGLAFGLVTAVAFLSTAAVVDRCARHRGLEAGLTASEGAAVLRRSIDRLPPRPRPLPGVLVLGDSTVVAYPTGRNVAERLRWMLGAEASVVSAGFPGSSFTVYYLIADEIVRASPDLVVVNFNPGTFGANFAGAFRPLRAGAATWLRPGRVWEAIRLPVAGVGLTLDTILFRMGLAQLGLHSGWVRVEAYQSRFVKTRDHGDAIAGERLGFPSFSTWRAFTHLRHEAAVRFEPGHTRAPVRLRREALREIYGRSLTGLTPDHPTLVRASAFLCEMREAGIPTLVYMNPTNVDQMVEVGATDPDTFAHSVDVIQSRVEDCGAHFVDLHAIFRDEAFTDGHGHMRVDEALDAPRVIANQLTPTVRQLLSASRDGREAP